jgi:hypothetical protein
VQNASVTDPIRVVIDETSFDFRKLVLPSIEEYLDAFNDAVWDLRDDGILTWCPPMLDGAKCTDEHELYEYLMSGPGTAIDRDTKNRFFGLISKCPDWGESIPDLLDVSFSDGEPVMALSAALALKLALHGHGVACLVFGSCPRDGFVVTSNAAGHAEIFFFAGPAELPAFWRHLYELEDVPEATFFDLAGRAFPKLIYNPNLSFRRFEGAYRDLRAQVVKHLSVLNDRFLSAYGSANGIARDVEAILASAGCPGISPESSNTHSNERVMKQRDVEYQGELVRCEWHTKIEPHRNRIHFAFGDRFGDMVFVGIFVDHLDT